MNYSILLVDQEDNVVVALQDLKSDTALICDSEEIVLKEDIPTKHKFSRQDISSGDAIIMYGITVGKANVDIPVGSRITTDNITHQAEPYSLDSQGSKTWNIPDIEAFENRTFNGFYRSDGQVGTRNYWLVIPLVFCENRNIEVIRETIVESLGYRTHKDYRLDIQSLIAQYQSGVAAADILKANITTEELGSKSARVFENVDGIKFLNHEGGCGGTRQDAEMLCKLLAAYISHPNVAGATVLSLGCQNAQISLLESALRNNGSINKPIYILEQQKSLSEKAFIEEAIKKTFIGLMEANTVVRKPAPLSHMSLGLECGGSDGFSGITANPVLGYVSDMLVALKGKTILSEFPELNGVEQDLIDRCIDRITAEKFVYLMQSYAKRANEVGSGFDMNPSPGNIKDGLVTDAMKSAGAAKKGGTSPVVDVLDYAEVVQKSGLNLLCTPGNDVESTTGLSGAGANLIVFTTGLGTPTGNPIAPVVKIASNNTLAKRMRDIIDFNAGTILVSNDTLENKAMELLELLIQVANGEVLTKAEILGQDDFIPWKRGISL